MSSPEQRKGSWAGDRRFMGMAGREVHEGSSRRLSGGATEAAAPKVAAPPKDVAAESEPGKTFSFAPFAGDRRFVGMSGKEVHEPAVRRTSTSSNTSAKASSPTASSPPQGSLTGVAAAIAGRRRSSAAAQGGGIGSGMMATRSGDHIDARRETHAEMKAPGGFGSLFGGFLGGSGDKK